jgi:hydrogenase/urease accessory protein HupE
LVSTGFGKFYDGVAHLAMTPSDLLVVLGVGLLAGLCGAAAARPVLVLMPLAWLCGGLIGMALPESAELPVIMTLSFGLLGVLVALDLALPRAVVLGLACGAGFLHGYVNGATMTAGGRDWPALVGATTAVFVLATLLPAMVVSLRAAWMRIAVRVAGSWIAAVGILVLGWLARGKY